MNIDKVPSIRVLVLLFEPNLKAIFPRVICTENTLEGLREVIGCHYVTCTEIKVEGKYFDVWSNDEALLCDNPVPTLYLNEDLILFGNLIFAKHDDEGETIGLTVSDVISIRQFIHTQSQKLEAFFSKGA